MAFFRDHFAIASSCENPSLTKLNATATQWMLKVYRVLLLQLLLTPFS